MRSATGGCSQFFVAVGVGRLHREYLISLLALPFFFFLFFGGVLGFVQNASRAQVMMRANGKVGSFGDCQP